MTRAREVMMEAYGAWLSLPVCIFPVILYVTPIAVCVPVQVSMYLWGGWLRAHLEWSPGAWWRAPWRLFSYGLVHASATHLATNAIVALAVSSSNVLSFFSRYSQPF